MDSYHKVVVPQERKQDNEIFVNSKSPASHLLSRVMALFKVRFLYCSILSSLPTFWTIDSIAYTNYKL